MSDQNKHAAEAQDIITANAGSSLGHETADAQHIVCHIEANTQATLALAHEQRTANLLALHSALRDRNEHRKAFGVLEVVNERLGL
jgi:hypothetical protein